MALPNITFQKQQGQLNRQLPGQDYISGLIFYVANGNLPSGFTPTNNILSFLSANDAINAGITNTYSDATAATASYLLTAIGAVGDIVTITALSASGLVITLATYVRASGDTTVALLAASIEAAINANTNSTGWSATLSTATVTLIAPKNQGIFLNSGTPYTVTVVGSVAGTLTQNVIAGVASLQAIWYYHISEFFRLQPNGQLFVGMFPIPSPYTFTEITTLQNFALGTIRQVGIYKTSSVYASADLTLIDGVIKTYNDAFIKNMSALYGADLSGTSNISTLPDLSVLTANKATSIISQDGGAQGAYLFKTTGLSITNLGAALGALALSTVSENFGNPIPRYNLSNGVENDTIAFANGVLLTAASISNNLLNSLDAKRHVFMVKYQGYAGSYFNDNHTSIAVSSDYAYINDNRTIDKAIRNIYANMIPALKSKLTLNADGTFAMTTIQYLQTLALNPLQQMARDGDLSAVVPTDVYINPSQNVKATSTVIVVVQLNENGIARQIIIPIGYKPSTT